MHIHLAQMQSLMKKTFLWMMIILVPQQRIEYRGG
jgi:hypothetical protein